MPLDPGERRQHQPRDRTTEHDEDDEEEQRRPRHREEQHPSPQQRRVARHAEARRRHRVAVRPQDRHRDPRRPRPRRHHLRVARRRIDPRLHLEERAELLGPDRARHQHVAARDSAAVRTADLRHADRRHRAAQPRVEPPRIAPCHRPREVGLPDRPHERRAHARPLGPLRVDPAHDHHPARGGDVRHPLDVQVRHRQRREALALERRARPRHVVVARGPVAVVAHRRLDLGGIVGERGLRPLDMAVDRLGLQRVERWRDDRREQHGDADRAADADDRQQQHQLGAQRALRPQLARGHQPSVPVAASGTAGASPMNRRAASSRAASAGIGLAR